MILNNIQIPAYTIENSTYINVTLGDNIPPFPILAIDRDSYIVDSEIQSGLNFDIQAGVHSIQIGRYCSLADKITFMVNLNHDYLSVTTAAATFLKNISTTPKIPNKGQILLQNDIWIGHGTTIMGGVTIHNGAVIASESVVSKDVPPYAIVGGNPAKPIKYRFNTSQIQAMQEIAWWDWDIDKLNACKKDFLLPIDDFIHIHHQIPDFPSLCIEKDKTTFLFFPDFHAPHPIYEKVIREYCDIFGDNKEVRLLIYLSEDTNTTNNLSLLEKLLDQHYSGNGDIFVQVGQVQDERSLFLSADYFITSRAFETVRRTCLADLCGVTCVSGVDKPIFHLK